jgi:hypothetical protein
MLKMAEILLNENGSSVQASSNTSHAKSLQSSFSLNNTFDSPSHNHFGKQRIAVNRNSNTDGFEQRGKSPLVDLNTPQSIYQGNEKACT